MSTFTWVDNGETRSLTVSEGAHTACLHASVVRDNGARVYTDMIAIPAEQRAAVAALLAPEPEPSAGTSDADLLVDRLFSAMRDHLDLDMCRSILAEDDTRWNGPTLEAQQALSKIAALICPPEPEPTEEEIEAGAKALLLNWQGADTEDLLNDPEWRGTYLQGAKAVLAAARTARQTGGGR